MSEPASEPNGITRSPALTIVNPSGNRSRVPLDHFPFTLGRQGGNDLVLRDNRISRDHARIVSEEGQHFIEDLNSRHGVFVNSKRVERYELADGDRIDFGFPDSYRVIFKLEDDEIRRFMEQMATQASGSTNLSKLRSLVEVARALQSSLSTNDVLAAVVDAALSVTGAERGFLLLKKEEELEVSVARDQRGAPLPPSELGVPRSLIHRALRTRRELLSMTFDPLGEGGIRPEMSVADLELRSVVCVPLIHVRTGSTLQDTIATSLNDTVGVLYMDSRETAADLSAGNREILQTLALEASTILENARLLEEERGKRRLEEELNVARAIQQDLLPSALPSDGWFRAAGSSITSRQVGGDYFDVRPISHETYACVIADVSGKGVSAALLAALLQGAFLLAAEGPVEIEGVMSRINRFLTERAKGEKYATVCYCTVDRSGRLCWSNAGHPQPILVRGSGELHMLESTGLPLGMLEPASYEIKSIQLQPGDKVLLYSDGVSEAASAEGEFFDRKKFRETLRSNASLSCGEFHAKLMEAVEDFSEGAELADDITTLVLEYQP